MDNEVVPRLYKICDWLLRFAPRAKCQSDHGVQGPQKTNFKAYVIHYHDPTDFAVGEARKVL